ncbi:MAG: di-trans,poly-cis-decaprenylcistransferase [SAR202 cluster bacterium]|nr:di-trans,poly-cis-decaprenylcistransferase [SAR202 cluster bacterium]
MSSFNEKPNHIAIIMDGNGRWAIEKGMSRKEGHYAGLKNIYKVVNNALNLRIKNLSLFAFSNENWQRNDSEIKYLLQLMNQTLDEDMQSFENQNVKLNHIGRSDRLPKKIQEKIKQIIHRTKNNTSMNLNIVFDFGGREEILNAVKKIIASKPNTSEINQEFFEKYLYSGELPDVDLVIRTSGEMRLSNFFLWKAHYAEFYSTKVKWPDFNLNEMKKALSDYNDRHRRYGKTTP